MVARRHAREQLDALERAADAEAGAAVRGDAGEVAAVEGHAAVVGPEDAEEAVEERGLARAVGPDQADDLARFDVEINVIERGDTGERLGDALGDEEAHGAVSAGPAGATSGAGVDVGVDPRLNRSMNVCTFASDFSLLASSTPSGCLA